MNLGHAYASEKLRQSRFAFTEEDLKPLVPAEAAIASVRGGSRLFGLRLVRREGVDVWHPEVRFFDIWMPTTARSPASIWTCTHAPESAAVLGWTYAAAACAAGTASSCR